MPDSSFRVLLCIDHDYELELGLQLTETFCPQVTNLTPHSRQAGFGLGDCIVSINGVNVSYSTSVTEVESRIVNASRPAAITVIRNGIFSEVVANQNDFEEIKCGYEWDVCFSGERAGLSIQKQENDEIEEVVVVEASVPASNYGVSAGDIILAIDGERVVEGTHHVLVAAKIADKIQSSQDLVISFFRPPPQSSCRTQSFLSPHAFAETLSSNMESLFRFPMTSSLIASSMNEGDSDDNVDIEYRRRRSSTQFDLSVLDFKLAELTKFSQEMFDRLSEAIRVDFNLESTVRNFSFTSPTEWATGSNVSDPLPTS